jgi:VIT1/CCC1 family predicted Fe2+/Mn2+ transporter
LSKGQSGKKYVFREEHLSEGDMQIEMLCGVIMVLVMIGYLKLSLVQEGVEFQKIMILVPLGCNAAWGIIDGIMYVLINLRERGNKSKLVSLIKSAKDQNEVLALIKNQFGFAFIDLLNKDTQSNIYEEILKGLKNATVEKPKGISKNDLRLVLKTFLVVFSTGVPLVMPFFLLNDIWLAIRISHIIGLIMLFSIGYWWAKLASRHRIRSAIAVTILGVAIVGITEILHG